MIYEYASSMASRGHQVHLFHVAFLQANVTAIDQIDWFWFSGDVIHHFPPPGPVEADEIPTADVIFGYSSETELHPRVGLPVVLIQGWKMLGATREREAFHAPCPKVCVASWLVDVGRKLGVPDQQLVHVPLGLRREKYRLQRPITERPPRVSFCYSAHVQKGAELALGVLGRVKRLVPELEVTFFGAVPPQHDLPEWVSYRTNPPQEELVDDIYNRSRVFLCTSEVEGFGLTSVEAMACGAALVTTDNGGSHDYALPDRTALVAPTGDAGALTEHLVSLFRDEPRRVRLATAGHGYVARFDWEHSGELLERFLERYLTDPARYGRPPEPVKPVGDS